MTVLRLTIVLLSVQAPPVSAAFKAEYYIATIQSYDFLINGYYSGASTLEKLADTQANVYAALGNYGGNATAFFVQQ